jgi:hypothetical protein
MALSLALLNSMTFGIKQFMEIRLKKVTGKNYGWHKQWSDNDRGQVVHASGLVFDVIKGKDFFDVVVDKSTLKTFQTIELSRGVGLHQIVDRLRCLSREASQWVLYSKKQEKQS